MKNKNNLVIATRGSNLAIAQALIVKNWIDHNYPSINTKLNIIKTKGDKILSSPLNKILSKGLFVKEIEESLLAKQSDLAVHSMKDVPTTLPPGLIIGAICKRENPLDVFISFKYNSLRALPNTRALVGTGSLRRQNQIKLHFPNIQFEDIRGNVNTRLEKLKKGNLDGIILAFAAMKRLNIEKQITEIINADICIPAVGQGAIGIECRGDDEFTKSIINKLNHTETASCINAERAFMKKLEGGCQIPIGGYAYMQDDEIILNTIITSLDGKHVLKEKAQANVNKADILGITTAETLIKKGALDILQTIRLPKQNKQN